MKQATTSKEAIEIHESIKHLFEEFKERVESNNLNPAYDFALETNLISEIDDCLKKLRLKRTEIEHENVQEITEEDVDEIVELMKKMRK